MRFAQRCQARVWKSMEFIAKVVEALGVSDEVNSWLGRHVEQC